jgi:hypothetical protein
MALGFIFDLGLLQIKEDKSFNACKKFGNP